MSSGKHLTWDRAQKRSLNRTCGKILTWSKDSVRTGQLSLDDAKGVAKYCQAVLRRRPVLIRHARSDLNVHIPQHLLSELADVAGEGIL